MPGYALLRRPRSGRFSAFSDPCFRRSAVLRFRSLPLFRCLYLLPSLR